MPKISEYTDGGALQPTDAIIVVRGAGNVRAFSQLYDVGFYFPGVPGDDAIISRIVIPRACYLPSGATNSRADAATAATGSTTLTIRNDATDIGTIVWSAAGTTGAFTVAANRTFAAGDVLSVVGPATADATLADISITLALLLGAP